MSNYYNLLHYNLSYENLNKYVKAHINSDRLLLYSTISVKGVNLSLCHLSIVSKNVENCYILHKCPEEIMPFAKYTMQHFGHFIHSDNKVDDSDTLLECLNALCIQYKDKLNFDCIKNIYKFITTNIVKNVIRYNVPDILNIDLFILTKLIEQSSYDKYSEISLGKLLLTEKKDYAYNILIKHKDIDLIHTCIKYADIRQFKFTIIDDLYDTIKGVECELTLIIDIKNNAVKNLVNLVNKDLKFRFYKNLNRDFINKYTGKVVNFTQKNNELYHHIKSICKTITVVETDIEHSIFDNTSELTV